MTVPGTTSILASVLQTRSGGTDLLSPPVAELGTCPRPQRAVLASIPLLPSVELLSMTSALPRGDGPCARCGVALTRSRSSPCYHTELTL